MFFFSSKVARYSLDTLATHGDSFRRGAEWSALLDATRKWQLMYIVYFTDPFQDLKVCTDTNAPLAYLLQL